MVAFVMIISLGLTLFCLTFYIFQSMEFNTYFMFGIMIFGLFTVSIFGAVYEVDNGNGVTMNECHLELITLQAQQP